MSAETIPMFKNLPVDNPPEEPKYKFQETLIKLLELKNVQLADIERETKALDETGKGVPWSTLMGWYRGFTKSPPNGKSLQLLSEYFEVTTNYLLYGVGEEPVYCKLFKKRIYKP